MVSNSIKIATLNLNGETYWAINRRPRLPKNMFNIQEIKYNLLELQKEGLDTLLREARYDIIAFQELVNIIDYKNQIKDIINKNNYVLLVPEIRKAHFVCGFIVKEQYYKNDNSFMSVNLNKDAKQSNRFAVLNISKDDKKYKLVNVHIVNHGSKLVDRGDIILGDMNAYFEEQVSDNKKGANIEFLKNIEKEGYVRIGNNTDYTWKSNNIERCLDHIYVKKMLTAKRMDKNDEVNFYYSDKGFTDHSLIATELTI